MTPLRPSGGACFGGSTRSYRRRSTSIPCRFRTFGDDYTQAMVELVSEGHPTTTLEELFLNIVRDAEARPGRRIVRGDEKGAGRDE